MAEELIYPIAYSVEELNNWESARGRSQEYHLETQAQVLKVLGEEDFLYYGCSHQFSDLDDRDPKPIPIGKIGERTLHLLIDMGQLPRKGGHHWIGKIVVKKNQDEDQDEDSKAKQEADLEDDLEEDQSHPKYFFELGRVLISDKDGNLRRPFFDIIINVVDYKLWAIAQCTDDDEQMWWSRNRYPFPTCHPETNLVDLGINAKEVANQTTLKQLTLVEAKLPYWTTFDDTTDEEIDGQRAIREGLANWELTKYYKGLILYPRARDRVIQHSQNQAS